MKTIFNVISPNGTNRFVANLHQHTSPDQFFLHPEDFYRKWGNSVPEGTHYEIEILEPSTEVLRRKTVHVHDVARSSNLFICYPLHIPTLEKAVQVFKTWCLGTVLTWEYDIDLNTLRDGECKGDDALFIEILRERHGITLPIGDPVLFE